MIGKVEYGGTYGEFEEVASRSEHKDFVFIQIHLKLVHRLHAFGILEHRADIRKPLVEACLAFHALVAPVGSHTAFGYLVHTFCADLHLHPFLFRAEHCDMQTLVAIGFWH